MSDDSKPTKPGRTPTGQFQRGHSGNPRGRARGQSFGQLIRDETDDGVELVEILLRIARGQMSITRHAQMTGAPYDAEPDFKERIDAVKLLMDRGWGKAIAAVVVDDANANQGEVTDARERLAARVAALVGAGGQGGGSSQSH